MKEDLIFQQIQPFTIEKLQQQQNYFNEKNMNNNSNNSYSSSSIISPQTSNNSSIITINLNNNNENFFESKNNNVFDNLISNSNSNNNINNNNNNNENNFNSNKNNENNNKLENEEELETKIYGFNLKSVSIPYRFLICLTGVFGFYLIYAITHEYIFKDGFQFGFFLTLFQFLIYTIGSGIERVYSGEKLFKRNAPITAYLMVGFFSVASMGLSNQALQYVNYPTHVVFKSSKLLAVMVSGVCITGKKYNLIDYIAALFLVWGLIILSKSSVDAELYFELTGIVLLSMALFADAFVGNLQEMTLKTYNASSSELIFFAHLVGVFYLLSICFFTDQLVPSINFIIEKPSTLGVMFTFSFLGFIGANFFFAMMKEFGVLVAVTTTSCRKVVTLLLSFVLFPKPFGQSFLLATILVFSGITLNIYNKNQQTINEYLRKKFKFLNKPQRSQSPILKFNFTV